MPCRGDEGRNQRSPSSQGSAGFSEFGMRTRKPATSAVTGQRRRATYWISTVLTALPERRSESAVPNRRASLDPGGTQTSVLNIRLHGARSAGAVSRFLRCDWSGGYPGRKLAKASGASRGLGRTGYSRLTSSSSESCRISVAGKSPHSTMQCYGPSDCSQDLAAVSRSLRSDHTYRFLIHERDSIFSTDTNIGWGRRSPREIERTFCGSQGIVIRDLRFRSDSASSPYFGHQSRSKTVEDSTIDCR